MLKKNILTFYSFIAQKYLYEKFVRKVPVRKIFVPKVPVRKARTKNNCTEQLYEKSVRTIIVRKVILPKFWGYSFSFLKKNTGCFKKKPYFSTIRLYDKIFEFLGVKSCEKSIARIAENWKCFPDPDSGKI